MDTQAKIGGVGFTVNGFGILTRCDDWETVTHEPDGGKHPWFGTHRQFFEPFRIGKTHGWKATPAFYAHVR